MTVSRTALLLWYLCLQVQQGRELLNELQGRLQAQYECLKDMESKAELLQEELHAAKVRTKVRGLLSFSHTG